jgi:hypothetical protein
MRTPFLANGLIVLVLAGPACTTQVVDLHLPDAGAGAGNPGTTPDAATIRTPDAAPGGGTSTPDAPAKCEMVRRDDGTVCALCFAPDGTVVNGSCEPAKPVPPPPVADAAPTVPMCKVVPRGDLRCRVCSAASGDYTACLVCQEAMPFAGEKCRPCAWSDLPEQRCLQCFGADGGVSHDDCDNFRKEVVAPGGV